LVAGREEGSELAGQRVREPAGWRVSRLAGRLSNPAAADAEARNERACAAEESQDDGGIFG
jgi:hypothetical protein